jgi:uncharacterized membrane protein YbhN (UPF0104 family)
VRDEVKASTTGPGIRTVLLNYAGLLILAGAGILIQRPEEAVPVLSTSLFVIAPIVLIIGIAAMFGSGKLGSITKHLPRWIREKIEDSTIDHFPGWESQIYIWTRLLLETAAFYFVMVAFGIDITVMEAIAVSSASQIIGGLPGMPGGLGVTEGAIALLLAAYGYPASSTVAPILVYRIVSYWLPAALSFLAGGSTFLRSDEAKAAAEANS